MTNSSNHDQISVNNNDVDQKNIVKDITGDNLRNHIEAAAKIIVISTTALYILGYLTINSYLSKYGYFEQEVTSPRFIISGGLCGIYFLSWYAFSGRSIYNMKICLADDIDLLKIIGAGRRWIRFIFVKNFVHVLFFQCMSSTTFGFMAFDSPSQMIYFPFMLFAFLISYTIDMTNADITYPRFSFIAETCVKLSAIAVFALSAYIDEKLAILFAVFLGMSAYFNMVLDSFERRNSTKDKIVFTSIHASIFFLTSVTLFGLFFYGDIRPRIGGGQPVPAHLFLSEKVTIPGTTNETDVVSADIIYRNSSNVLVTLKDSPIIFQTKSIKMIVIQPIKDTDVAKNLKIIFNKLGLALPPA